MDNTHHEDDLAGDMLRGIPSIARYLGEPTRRVYELAAQHKLPLFKFNGSKTWRARKSTLREHIRKLEGGNDGLEAHR